MDTNRLENRKMSRFGVWGLGLGRVRCIMDPVLVLLIKN